MPSISEFFNKMMACCRGEDFAAVGSRLKQIELDPHRHDYNFQVLDEMHNAKVGVRHNRRVEHHSREFWNDPRAEHPDEVLHDSSLPLHQSAITDRQAADRYMIKDMTNDQLYNYTARLPIIHEEDN